MVRKAFKLAQPQKPGPTHIELPEDVMAAEVDGEPLPVRTRLRRPEPSAEELLGATQVIPGAIDPSCWRATASCASAPRRDARVRRAKGIGVAETFMGKGLDSYEDRLLGTVGVPARDAALAGFEDADVVITVGYDLVEHSPGSGTPPRQDNRLHRHGLGRGRRPLHH